MAARGDLVHPRDAIARTMDRIYQLRMTTTSGGNLSIRDDDGSIWITPARVDKGGLRPADVVRVQADGAVEGLHKPSSEAPFHRAIYEARPDLRAIVHAHPVALVAFSICRRVPDTRLLPQARRVCGAAGFAPYALPGSMALGRSIASTFADGFDCVVLENHGVVTGGSNLPHAFERFETLEFAAKTIVKASLLGDVRYLSDEEVERSRLRAPLAARPRSAPASSPERDLRRQVVEFVRRCYRQRLMISTVGALSARLDEDAFLITPHHVDRSDLDVDDLVLIRGESAESDRSASSSWRNHRAIYAEHPEVRSIVHAYPVHATAFGATTVKLDTRTIPESYVFLRDVGRVPFGNQLGDGGDLARLTSLENPALILENDGVQVCGTTVLDAFDRLEVLEATAEAMIDASALDRGSISYMPDDVIDELKAAFGLV